MKKEAETLIKYVQADFSERIFLFLQNPDLRDVFQEIERSKFRCPNGLSYSTEQPNEEECVCNPSLPIGACSLTEIRMYKTFLESLTGLKPKRGIS